MLKLRDEMSPALAKASQAASAAAEKMMALEEAAKRGSVSQRDMAKAMDALHGAALKLDATLSKEFVQFNKNVDVAHGEALKMHAALESSAQRAGKFADSIGRTSTVLARSADAFGLPTQALRTLDDVADVAELGLANLGKGAASTALSFKTLQLSMLGPVAAAAAIGAALGTLLNKIDAVRNRADALFPAMARLLGLMGEVDSRPLANVSQSAFQAEIAAKHAEAQKKQVEGLRAIDVSTKEIAKLYEDTMTPELQKQLGLTKGAVKAEEDRAAAAKKSAEEMKNLTDLYSGAKAREDIAKFSQATAGMPLNDAIIGRARELAKEADRVGVIATGLPGAFQAAATSLKTNLLPILPEIAKDLDLSKLPGFGVPQQSMTQFSFATKTAAEDFAKLAQEMRDSKKSAQEIGIELMRMGASAEEAAAAIGSTFKRLSLGDSLKGGLKAGLKDLPNVILGAIQGGGDVFRAVGASLGGRLGESMAEPLTKILSKKLGDTLGGALGSLLPGLGSLLGSSLGSLVSKGLSKLGSALGIGGNKEIMALNDIRDSFLASHGGFVELQKKLQGLSNQDLVKKIFDAKTVDQFNAAVSEVNRLLGNQEEAQAALQDAVERYGFTVEELGPKFRQQELDSQAGQLLQDFQLLTASGIETGVVLTKMSENLSEYVQTAVRAGVSVPEAMRPMIEAAIQNGTLLDENGQAYASAEEAGITFAQTMSEQFSTLIDKIGELVAALTGVPNVSRTVTVDTVYNDRGDGGAGGAGSGDYGGVPDDYRAAAGFNAMVTKPTRILVGEAGPEHVLVTPKGKMAETGGVIGAGTGLSIAATFNIDPLQSNAGRDDLAKHSIETFIRQARSSPMIRQLLRQNGGR